MLQRNTLQPGTRTHLQLCRQHREARPIARRTRDISRGDRGVCAAAAARGRQAQRGGAQRAQRGGRAAAQRARERRQRLAVQEQRIARARRVARCCAARTAPVSAQARDRGATAEPRAAPRSCARAAR